jgi:hypothetical protein
LSGFFRLTPSRTEQKHPQKHWGAGGLMPELPELTTDSNQVQVANLGNLEDHAEGVACHVAYHAAVVGRVAGHVAPGQARQVAGQAGVVVAMDVHLAVFWSCRKSQILHCPCDLIHTLDLFC